MTCPQRKAHKSIINLVDFLEPYSTILFMKNKLEGADVWCQAKHLVGNIADTTPFPFMCAYNQTLKSILI